jgi:hypothetical protein
MKKLTLLVVMLAVVLLASAPALTQTTPSNLDMSPAQEMQTDQTVGNTDVAQPATTPNPVAAPSTPPTPKCGWYDNPERGWGWDYWCYHPTQNYWVPVFYGVT